MDFPFHFLLIVPLTSHVINPEFQIFFKLCINSFKFVLNFLLFLVLHGLDVFPACMLNHVYAVLKGPEKGSNSPELELQKVVNCHVGAKEEQPVLLPTEPTLAPVCLK